MTAALAALVVIALAGFAWLVSTATGTVDGKHKARGDRWDA